MKSKNFCEAIKCPGRTEYYLENFRCSNNYDWCTATFPCCFLDVNGKARKDADSYYYAAEFRRSEIQILAALIKEKEWKRKASVS